MTVRLWDLVAGKQLLVLPCERGGAKQGRINAVAFSPDGKLVAACNDSKGVVQVWDVSSGKAVREFSQKGTATLAFSPDGKELAAGGWDHKVDVWDLTQSKQLRTLAGGQIVDAVAYSPDGRLIATGHHNHWPISLWVASTGELVRKLKVHDEVIWTVTFSPDGQWIASGGTDGTVQLWDVASGKEVLRRQGHEFWIMSLAFSPDGRTLASGGYDGISYLWDLRPKPEPLPAGGAESLWDVLGDDDPVKVYRAIWALADRPQDSIGLVRAHVGPKGTKPDAERVRGLIADLNDDEFAKRETASRALAKLGDAIESDLRDALAKADAPEQRRRLETLVSRLRRELSAEELRQVRALGVLEMIGNAEAAGLLRTLADDTASGPVRRQAKAALERLSKRSLP
jgi:uncharacterized protein with WD repeat